MPQLIEIPGRGQVEFPDGMSDEAIASAIKRNFMIGTNEAPKKNWLGFKEPNAETASAIQGAKTWGTGMPAASDKAATKVTDTALGLGMDPQLSSGLGAFTHFGINALPILLTATKAPMGAPVPASLTEKPARALMQSSVKPSLADLKSGDADKAMSTMLAENIYPTRSGMEKASNIAGDLEKQVQEAIARSTSTVSVPAVTSRLDPVMQKAGMQVNPQADTAAVEDVWTKFLTNPNIVGRREIPVQLAQELKKGTYQALGGKAYGEVGSSSTEAQKALARGLREETATAVPSVVDPLKREASMMNVLDVAGNRALQQGNNNPMGLAALRMDSPMSAATFMADRLAAFKAFLAMQLYGAGKPNVFGPALMASPQVQEALKQQGLYSP